MSEDSKRASWSDHKERLKAAGFRPSRRLGQNFLLDENMTRALVRDAGVGEGDFVLEIGPGLGFLTRPLLEAGAQVLAVEIDGRLFESLQSEFGAESRLSLLHTDALAGKHELCPKVSAALPTDRPWKLVANLPYAISAPLMVVLGEQPHPPDSMSVLVQLEVAERICAGPGGKEWGPLSARLQIAYEVELGRRVGPGMFWPRPKVDSAVAHLRRRADAPALEDQDRFSQLCAGLFQRRRQGLGRVLGELLGDRERATRLLAEISVEPSRRADTLDLEQLRQLADSAPWRARIR